MRNNFATSGYAIATALVLATVLGVRGCSRYVRWKYDQRVVQANAFKREFDGRFPPSARQADVDAYLQSRAIEVLEMMTAEGSDEPSYVGQYFIVVTRAKSLAWYCANDSFGVQATFSRDGYLRRSEIQTRSNDCL